MARELKRPVRKTDDIGDNDDAKEKGNGRQGEEKEDWEKRDRESGMRAGPEKRAPRRGVRAGGRETRRRRGTTVSPSGTGVG